MQLTKLLDRSVLCKALINNFKGKKGRSCDWKGHCIAQVKRKSSDYLQSYLKYNCVKKAHL